MAKSATTIRLTPEEEETIRSWIGEAERQQRRAERARIVLLASLGWNTEQIARSIGGRPSRVSKWRVRFANAGLAGLENAVRAGRPRTYDQKVDARILALASQPPPEPARVWTGPLIAQAVGNVTVDHVWRVLRNEGVVLRRSDPQEIDTVPAPMSLAGLAGLYLAHGSCAFLVRITDATATTARMSMFSCVRAPSVRLAQTLRSQWNLSTGLIDAIQSVISAVESGSYSSASVRSLEDFLIDARIRSPGADIHSFVLSGRPLTVPDVHLHPISTFDKWMDRLASFLDVFPPGAVENRNKSVSQLLAAIEKLAALYGGRLGAPFEWQSWTGRSS